MTGLVNGILTTDPMKRDGGASQLDADHSVPGFAKTCGLKIRRSQSISACMEKENDAAEDSVLVNTCYTLATV